MKKNYRKFAGVLTALCISTVWTAGCTKYEEIDRKPRRRRAAAWKKHSSFRQNRLQQRKPGRGLHRGSVP